MTEEQRLRKNQKQRDDRKVNRVRYLANERKYRDSHPEYVEGLKEKQRNMSVESKMLRDSKSRAKTRGLPFDLDISDIVVPEFCPYLNVLLEKGIGRHQPNSPSLDRIIPELGYVKGNVQVISYKANSVKNNLTLEELLVFANAIQILHYKGGK